MPVSLEAQWSQEVGIAIRAAADGVAVKEVRFEPQLKQVHFLA